MSKTSRYQPNKAKESKPRPDYKVYFCGNCGVNAVERPGAICWECEFQVE